MKRQGSDDGFTLIELLVAIVLAGVISIAIGTALLIGFKTTFATAQTVSQSGNAQQLAQYFPSDVQSASASGVDTITTTGTGCSGSVPAGSNLVQFTWTDAATTNQFAADYRREGTVIRRYSCGLGGSPTIHTVARDITAAAVALAGVRVTLTVTVQDPTEYLGPPAYTFSVSGSRRAPGASCTANGASIVITPVPAAVDSAGHLASAITVTFTTDGVCGAASVTYQYAGSGATSTVTATTTPGSGNWSATIPSASNTWTVGTKALTITAGSTTGSTTFNVYDPASCVPASATPTSVSPNPVNEAGGVLSAAIVTFTTTGTCHGVTTGQVTYQYGATAAETDTAVLTSTPGSGNTLNWQAALTPVEATAWTPGAKAFNVSVDVASGSGTFTVNVAPVCTVTSGSVTASPATANLAVGQASSGQLRAAVTVTFSTTGPCSSASLTYQYNASASATLPAAGGPTNWTATIPALAPSGGSFTVGTKTLTATAGASTATGSYSVAAGCVLTTPISITGTATKSGNNLAPPTPVVTFKTSPACAASDLSVVFQYGSSTAVNSAGTPSAAVPASNPDGTLNWTFSLTSNLGNGNNWTKGSKDLHVTLGATTTTTTFTVN